MRKKPKKHSGKIKKSHCNRNSSKKGVRICYKEEQEVEEEAEEGAEG